MPITVPRRFLPTSLSSRRVLTALLALVWLLQGLGLVLHPLTHLTRAAEAGKVTLAADAETVTAGLTSQLPDQPPADPHCTVCLVAAHSGDLLLYTPVMVLLQALLAVMVLTRLRGIRVPTVVHSLSRAPPAPFPVA